jgi:hypothetical protein
MATPSLSNPAAKPIQLGNTREFDLDLRQTFCDASSLLDLNVGANPFFTK